MRRILATVIASTLAVALLPLVATGQSEECFETEYRIIKQQSNSSQGPWDTAPPPIGFASDWVDDEDDLPDISDRPGGPWELEEPRLISGTWYRYHVEEREVEVECEGSTSTTSPTTSVPDTTVPDTTVPDTTVPDTTVPDTTVPDTTVPDTTVPDTTVPDTTVPDTTVPDTTVPDTMPTIVTGDPDPTTPPPDTLPYTGSAGGLFGVGATGLLAGLGLLALSRKSDDA